MFHVVTIIHTRRRTLIFFKKIDGEFCLWFFTRRRVFLPCFLIIRGFSSHKLGKISENDEEKVKMWRRDSLELLKLLIRRDFCRRDTLVPEGERRWFYGKWDTLWLRIIRQSFWMRTWLERTSPIIECMTLGRDCRRYRTVPLEAFVKGHLRVVWKASTKVFDGYEKNIRQKIENL